MTSEPTMMEDRLFPLVAFLANQKTCTLFVAMRISVNMSDWSTFEVCIQNSCCIWEEWLSLILPIHIRRQSSYKEQYMTCWGCVGVYKCVLSCQVSVISHNVSVIYFSF